MLKNPPFPSTFRENTDMKDENEKKNPLSMKSESLSHEQAEDLLQKSEERYRSILENIEDGYYEVDLSGNFILFNDSLCRQLGYSREEMMGMNNREYMDEQTARGVFQAFHQVYTTGEPYGARDWRVIKKDGSTGIHEGSVSLIRDGQGKPIGFRGITRDITKRKRLEEDRERLIENLQDALSRIKVLSGLLPICASCKKIRDDKGYWNQLETYIRDHSEVDFTHAICPDCAKRLYGKIIEPK